jgi:hypothetical protein
MRAHNATKRMANNVIEAAYLSVVEESDALDDFGSSSRSILNPRRSQASEAAQSFTDKIAEIIVTEVSTECDKAGRARLLKRVALVIAAIVWAMWLLSGCKLHPKALHPKAILAGDPWCERVCDPADAGVTND